MLFNFKQKPICTTDPAASKNNARLKSGQNQLKNKHLALLITVSDSQPGCRDTQGCREEVSGVPPNV